MRRRHKARARSPELEILDASVPSDQDRPYYTRVRGAFIQTFADWYAGSTDAAHVAETKRLEKEWRKLAKLLFRCPPTNRNHDWRKLDPEPQQIMRVLRHSLRSEPKGRGRPTVSRSSILLALDLHAADPERWKWRAITDHVCHCGLREQNQAENLKCLAPKCAKFDVSPALGIPTLGRKLHTGRWRARSGGPFGI
jgi:hypothetical protein